jgi:hypothetical protein
VSGRRALRGLARFGLPVLVAFGIAFAPLVASDPPPDPVDVASDSALFDSVDDLVAASDAVVLAEVVEAADGRAITDPSDPTTGIRTRLAELRVVQVLAGSAPDALVLEEAATLLDGTPIAVDGETPVVAGDRGVFFLVAGGADEAPHWALVGAQGRYLVRGEHLEAAAGDGLSGELAASGGPALVDAVEAAAARLGGG